MYLNALALYSHQGRRACPPVGTVRHPKSTAQRQEVHSGAKAHLSSHLSTILMRKKHSTPRKNAEHQSEQERHSSKTPHIYPIVLPLPSKNRICTIQRTYTLPRTVASTRLELARLPRLLLSSISSDERLMNIVIAVRQRSDNSWITFRLLRTALDRDAALPARSRRRHHVVAVRAGSGVAASRARPTD